MSGLIKRDVGGTGSRIIIKRGSCMLLYRNKKELREDAAVLAGCTLFDFEAP